MLLVVISILFTSFCCVSSADYPVVSTSLGKISGAYEKSYNGRTFSSFYGIPFAKPPVGELRFQEPQPVSQWSGIWNASARYIMCVQVSHTPEPEGGAYMGDEDCLYLNVFVPSEDPASLTEPLDVIVHIHGGALMFGSGTGYTGPGYLMDRDVILVTINYRLGILGFLSTEDEIAPGNNGMKDQVMALRWIKDHIKNFGGNPNSVTLTGLSAGGASVHLHYLSPLSKGLFTRGVSFSGNALTPWVLQDEPLLKARLIGARLGCTAYKTKKLLKCLKQRSTAQLVESIRMFRPWLFNPFSPLGVVVEKAGNNQFLPEHPYVLLKEGRFHDVPWIISLTSEEGLYPAADFAIKENYFTDLEKRWLELAPFVLDYNYTVPADIKDEVSEKIKREYLQDRPISPETYKNLIDMMSDRLFSLPAEKAARMQAHKAESPDQNNGVSHGDDMMYIFTNPEKLTMPKLSHLDEIMKEKFMDMLTSFGAKGKPIINEIKWEAVSKDLKDPLKQLHIKTPTDIFMEDADVVDRHRSMWKSIPFAEDEKLFPNLEMKDEL